VNRGAENEQPHATYSRRRAPRGGSWSEIRKNERHAVLMAVRFSGSHSSCGRPKAGARERDRQRLRCAYESAWSA
jgi:hypothetical protein